MFSSSVGNGLQACWEWAAAFQLNLNQSYTKLVQQHMCRCLGCFALQPFPNTT